VRSLASSAAPSSALGLPDRQHRPLVIGCGALAHELVALTRRAGFPEVDLTCLPATLHNRPERIPEAVRARIRKARAAGRDRLFVAYADCGTGGLLDRVLEEEGVTRLEGAHCYEVYAGRAAFAELAEAEPGTFYLTDFLARNFNRLVIRGLGLDRHPELLPLYFGNYTRVVYLAQTDDPVLTAAARRGARRLGLRFVRRMTGYGELGEAMAIAAAGAKPADPDRQSRNPARTDAGPATKHDSQTPALRTSRGGPGMRRSTATAHEVQTPSQAAAAATSSRASQARDPARSARFGRQDLLPLSTRHGITVRAPLQGRRPRGTHVSMPVRQPAEASA
jgi:hypothetical protein